MQVTQVVVTHTQPVHSGGHPLGGFQSMTNDQVVGMYIQPMTTGQLSTISHQPMQRNPMMGIHTTQMQGGPYMGMHPHQMQNGQMVQMYPQQMYGNEMAAYGYGQQQGTPYLEQQMYGLSMRDEGGLKSSSYNQVSAPSYVQPMKPAKPEDKLFGDLVDMAKFKPTKQTPGRAGSM